MNGYIKLHQALYREPKLTPKERAERARNRRDRAIFAAGLYVTQRAEQVREGALQVRYLFDAAQYHTERGLLLRQRVSFIPGFDKIPIPGGDTVYALGYEPGEGAVAVPWQEGQNAISRLLKAGFDPRKKTFVHLPPVGAAPEAAEKHLKTLGAFLCRGSVFCLSARGYGAAETLIRMGEGAGLRLLEMAGAAELEQDFVGPMNRRFLKPMLHTPVDLVCSYWVKK